MDPRIATCALCAAAVLMLAGAALALAVRALVERGLYAPHAELLGKACTADLGGGEREHLVVAVSRRGAVALRPAQDPCARARWVPAEEAGGMVFRTPRRAAGRRGRCWTERR